MSLFKKATLKMKSVGEKDRTVAGNIIASFIIKGATMLIGLITLPAYMRYFPDQKILGVWFTILSVMTWIFTFDMGIGNGLRNQLVDALVKKDKERTRKLISSSYIIFSFICLFFSVIGSVLLTFVNWNRIFNIPSTTISSEVLRRAVTFVFIGIIIQFVLRLIISIMYALQKSALTNLIAITSSLLQLFYVLFAPSYGAERNLLNLSTVFIISSALPPVVATVIVFSGRLRDCRPGIRFFDRVSAKGLVSLGGVFFINQMLFMGLMATNEIIITQINGSNYVVEYNIYSKLFLLVGSFFRLALMPLWSAVTKATSEKDYSWLQKWFKRLNILAILASICEFLLVPFLQIIVNVWLGEKAIDINIGYALAFALFGSVDIFQIVVSTHACGTGKLKLQTVCYSAGLALKILYVFIAYNLRWNWIGLIIINSIVFIPYCILQTIFLWKEYRPRTMTTFDDLLR